MIVTEPYRLWLCRWLVAVLRRVARRDGVSLCPNYVVSMRALALADRDLYTAYELARMTPIAGLGTYRRMRRVNAWTAAYLPNAVEPPRWPASEVQVARGRPGRVLTRLARLGERALRSPMGTVLERCEMAYRIRKLARQGDGRGEAAYGADWYKAHVHGHRGRSLAEFVRRLRTVRALTP
jgi:hypothetical protein